MRDPEYPLWRSEYEHESCGVGAIVDLSGRATHRTIDHNKKVVARFNPCYNNHIVVASPPTRLPTHPLPQDIGK